MSNEQRFDDGLKYLEADHRLIEDYFRRIEQCDAFDEKKKLVGAMVAQISMHASAEERHLYPLFRTHLKNGEVIADRNVVDDQLNKEMMQLLLNMDPGRDGALFDRTLQKFVMIEKEHLQQEEEWFIELRKCLSATQLKQLESDIIVAKNNAPTFPHPMAPSKPSTGASILHPIVGTLDRMADKVTGRTTSA